MQIFIFTDHYLPGYKAGGPIRTLTNMVDRLGDEFRFKIVTADRDSGDEKPYPDVTVDGWNRVGKAEVFYMSPKRRSLQDFSRLLCSSEYDILYLNSFFSPHSTIKLLLLKKFQGTPDKPLIVAPRGEFSPGALGLKTLKKRVYLLLAKALGLYRGIVWQASSRYEEADIRRCFGNHVLVVVAPNLPTLVQKTKDQLLQCEKTAGRLKIVFLSRITRKKNLDGALKILKSLNGKVQFNIYGPLVDMNYWAKCRKIISTLPENIKCRYQGVVEHDRVSSVLAEHNLFFLPTLGENFGHVILEALVAGCPVLLSDQTPWHDLEKKGVGWDLPLNRQNMFWEALQRCIDMENAEYIKWSGRAREYGRQVLENDEVIEQNRRLFYKVVQM
ncbi:MAG: glycosyltransferase [Candidatus Marinimicrobia bacterium]|nr:glycosyltransferase [Candidatus Neomarinimicrobiota bacterium]